MMYPIWLTLEYASIRLRSLCAIAITAPAIIATVAMKRMNPVTGKTSTIYAVVKIVKMIRNSA